MESLRSGPTSDLFGLAQQQPRALDRKEAAALVRVLTALRRHPAVAWVERIDSGAVRIGGRLQRRACQACASIAAEHNGRRRFAGPVRNPQGLRPMRAPALFWRDGGASWGQGAVECLEGGLPNTV
jgi:hypothetical protein